jgi:allophanate hydrolase
MAGAWVAAKRHMTTKGFEFTEVDMRPFFETAELLYEGPWVAERHAAIETFMAKHAEAMLDVTRRIIEGAGRFSATDVFKGIYRLAELKRQTGPVWGRIDALAVPSAPIYPTLAEAAADPIGVNAKLGTYTNFVNLLDLAALAIPGPPREDGLPAGVTLIGASGSDARLAQIGQSLSYERACAASPSAKPQRCGST